MRGLILLVLAAPLLAQEDVEWVLGKNPYQVHALEFQIGVPVQWKVDQHATGMVVRDRSRMGYQITREPMLHDPKTFAETWKAELEKGGVKAEVKQTKAGRYTAWRAAWASEAGGGRDLEVWRLHAPENEMLYNIGFSVQKGGALEPLVERVLRTFKCTAPKARIRFQPTATSVATRISLTLPVGYTEVPRGVRLGGGSQVAYTRQLAGYEPPYESGRIGLRSLPAGGVMLQDGSVISGSNLKDVTQYVWKQTQGELGEVTKKARSRAARYAGLKGLVLSAEAKAKTGQPKSVFVFAGKLKRNVLVITMVVDERETRLYKDYFKQVCSKLDIQE